MPGPEPLIDRELLAERRRRALPGFADYAYLLDRAADDIAERVSLMSGAFETAAVIGPRQDNLVRRLRERAEIGELIAVESAALPETLADGLSVVADEEALPFAFQSLDLVASALALHFVNDLPGVLTQVRRALRPNGLLVASILGGETLRELHESWLLAESELTGGASPRVVPFADVRTLGNLLTRAEFALPVADLETVTITFPTALHLMRDLKGMGASNMLTARSRRPVSRRLLTRATEIYADRNTVDGDRVAATFEIVTLTAWAPHSSQPQPLEPGSATASLADALRPKG